MLDALPLLAGSVSAAAAGILTGGEGVREGPEDDGEDTS